jgi:carbonic anhydrase
MAGCEQIQGLVSPAAAHTEGGEKPQKAEKSEKAKVEGEKRAEAEPETSSDTEYALPFAWETSTAEPLGQARGFLREVYAANGNYAGAATKLFPAAGDKQGPRATVITCADARVQAGAFDGSPENDDFTVRNLGNVVENSMGSVEYGVEQLNTPVLLVIGHTGCGAVKAALDGQEAYEKLGKPISNEIAKIHLSKKAGETWGRAVVDNVRAQVGTSLQKFGRRVHAGRLTVVGAVLDLTNEMGFGAGRLIIVDVNGNHDEKRIAAFNQAIVGGLPFAGPSGHPDAADHAAPADRAESADHDRPDIEHQKSAAEHGKPDQAKPAEHAKSESDRAKPEAEAAKPQVDHERPAPSELKEGKNGAAHAKEPSGHAKRAGDRADHGGRDGRRASGEDEAAKALVAALATLPAARGRLASE